MVGVCHGVSELGNGAIVLLVGVSVDEMYSTLYFSLLSKSVL